MTEQPVEKPMDPADIARRRRLQASYRLAISLITARDDRVLQRQCIRDAAEGLQGRDVTVMYVNALFMVTEYVKATGNALNELSHDPDKFDESFRKTLRYDLLSWDGEA